MKFARKRTKAKFNEIVQTTFLKNRIYSDVKVVNMSRRRVIPRQHRRFSLPSTPTQLPTIPGYNRSIPEGSDIFQQALEDLYTNEPNHAPPKSENTFGDLGFNGLNNIQEMNESDYVESEDEVDAAAGDNVNQLASPGRRHSSPSCFTARSESDLSENFKTINLNNGTSDSVAKDFAKLRKQYFIKHGRWPVSNAVKLQRPSQQMDRKYPSSIKARP